MNSADVATRGRPTAWLVLGLVGAVGVANGALTLIAFGTLGEGWNTLGNSGAIWLLVAFAVGSIMPSAGLAAAAGAGSLAGSVVWFYAAAHYLVGIPVSSAAIAMWMMAALAGGPVFGLAGQWWRRGGRPRHVLGIALLGGVFIAEGVFMLLHSPLPGIVGWVEIASGTVLTVTLARSRRERLLGLLALPAVTALGLVAYDAIYGTLATF